MLERLRKSLWRVFPAVFPLLLVGCGVLGAGGDATPWTLTSPASDHDEALELEVFVGRLGCEELRDIHVDEARDRVVIESEVETVSEECAMTYDHEVVTVELDNPVGQRQIEGCGPGNGEDDCRNVDQQRLDPSQG